MSDDPKAPPPLGSQAQTQTALDAAWEQHEDLFRSMMSIMAYALTGLHNIAPILAPICLMRLVAGYTRTLEDVAGVPTEVFLKAFVADLTHMVEEDKRESLSTLLRAAEDFSGRN